MSQISIERSSVMLPNNDSAILVIDEDKHFYYLMNKDTKVAKFNVLPIVGTLEIEDVYMELPIWLADNLAGFIRGRKAPRKREHIQELLERSGCATLDGYLQITHALSLVDTFWVKPVDSELQWKDVSLFVNPFNEVIAKTAFEGGLHGNNFSTTSPEYGTDGTFAKCWIREGDKIKLLKRGSSGAANAGLEPYSEYYASQIVRELTNNSVLYDIRTHHNKLCSVCDCFTSEQFGYLPYAAIGKSGEDFSAVIKKMGEFGLTEETRDMFVIDAVIFNEDRHKGNFGFIVDNDKQTIEGMAPLFDHNISLLCYAMEDDFENLGVYTKQKGPRLSEDFFTCARACLTPRMCKKLINMRDFQFTRDSKYNLPEWRLIALEKFIQENIRKILNP